MRTLVEQPPAHLTSYHRDVGLAAQFILFELIQSYNEAIEIQQLASKKTRSNKSTKTILQLMVKLSGSNFHYRDHQIGSLIKLKNYCAFFISKMGGTDTYLLEAAERSWVYSLQALEVIQHLSAPIPSLLGYIEKIQHGIISVAQQFSQLLIQFPQDENIIYFILRFHTELDNLYGESFCFRLLEKMHPKGKTSLDSFLCRRYTQRGFESQIPTIKKCLTEIYD